MSTNDELEPGPLTKQDFEALARFRFGIRRFLRFSEETVFITTSPRSSTNSYSRSKASPDANGRW